MALPFTEELFTRLLDRIIEFSEVRGVATGGSTTELEDTKEWWPTDKYKDATVGISHDGITYRPTITSNTNTKLTFAALPVAVAAGDEYTIVKPITVADVSDSLRTVLGGGSNIDAGNPLQTFDAFQKSNIGDFTAQANLKSLLAVLGVPDVANKPLHTLLVTDRWDSRLPDARAAYIDNLIGSEPSGTYDHPNVTTEEDAVVITPSELAEYRTLLLDLSNLTQNTTIRTYIKVDAANYRLVDSSVFPTDFPANTKGVPIRLCPLSVNMKVTLESSVLEGAVRAVPYRYTLRSWA